MNTNQMIEFLKKIELFRGLNEKELESLVNMMEVIEFKPGELLFRENSQRVGIMVIYEGEVELFRSNPFGVELKLTYFTPGDFLGEGSWASNSPHSTSARALKPTKVFVLKDNVLSQHA
ncbi:MAG TPA: cyclic nucleotide-binding domain-containing protein, partial [Tenuifilaceae bacterium]|nr:cyclic nucleotide-binding domain-containing protein [Tenuifilaceae bacterium]